MLNQNSKILIVGHNGIVENALFQHFSLQNYPHVFASSQIGLDPINQKAVDDFFSVHKPEYVFLSATRSGGIEANQRLAAEFIYHNLQSQNNIIHAAYTHGIKKLLFFASSCIYPKECPQPMREEYLLTTPLEPTNEPYAVAKIAGVKLCQTYRRQYGLRAVVVVPATIYGPGMDVRLETAHVLGALLHKFHMAMRFNAQEVMVWGTGKPRREFLYVDDFIEASLFLMEHYDDERIIHIGVGYDISIDELAHMMAEVIGFHGRIVLDPTRPDGMMKKLLDNRRLKTLGWEAKTDLKEGIEKTYKWYSGQKRK